MTKKYTESIEGKDFEVTVLPPDPRLQPKRTRDRQLFNTLTTPQKKRYIRDRIKAAKKKRGRKKR